MYPPASPASLPDRPRAKEADVVALESLRLRTIESRESRSNKVCIEKTETYANGSTLRLLSVNRDLFDRRTGRKIENGHESVIWVEQFPDAWSPPQCVFTFHSSQPFLPPIAYTDPYGFVFATDDESSDVAVAFIDDQIMHFVEIDLDHDGGGSYSNPPVEYVGLSKYVGAMFGDANWQPKFSIVSMSRRLGQWSVLIGIGDKHIRIRRVGENQWSEF